MKALIKRFKVQEDGNAVIDWVVLTAGIATLGLAVAGTIGTGSTEIADNTVAAMQTAAPS